MKHRRAWPALMLMLVACTGTSEGETATPDDLERVVPECERLEQPCSWSETDDEVYTASMELLRSVGIRIDDGEPPRDVAADLAEDPRVVSVNADDGGVLFRLDGGLPVVVLTDETSPYALGADALAAEAPGQALRGTGRPEVVAAGPDVAPADPVLLAQSGDESTYETTRQPDIRPRRALVIQPFFEQDPQKAAADQASSTGEPVQPPEPANATREALDASPFFDVAPPVRDDEAGPGAFLGWGAYDLVLVQSHGWFFPCDFDEELSEAIEGVGERSCGIYIAGGRVGGAGSPTVVDEAALPPKVIWDEAGQTGVSVAWRDGGFRYAFNASFFAAVAPRDTIVILNVCRSSVDSGDGSVPNGLPQLLTAGGASAVFAWNTQIEAYAADNVSTSLVDLLAGNAVETSLAFQELEDAGLATMDVKGSPATLELFGANLRARDAIQAEDGGATMAPGAVIEVDGEPEDGEDDTIKSLTFRVDGVAESAATLSWELPVRHNGPRRVCLEFPAGQDDGGNFCPGQETGEASVNIRPAPAYGSIGPAQGGGRWENYLITFTNLDLEFDLEDDDLICCREHTLVAEIGDGDGVSRHEVIPVFLRKEVVEVLDPDLGQRLRPDEHVLIDGAAGDGQPEVYPLVVRMENIDEEMLEDLVLEVTLGGEGLQDQTLTFPGPDWDDVDEGTYRVETDVDLVDFEDREKDMRVAARIDLPRRGEISHVVDPFVLELEIADGCGLLSSLEVTQALGRPFANPVDVFGSTCLWSAERSEFQLSLFAGSAGLVDGMPADLRVDGIGDAAAYDPTDADTPSGIRIDGVINYTNFVNLSVAIDDDLVVLHPQGNIVIEDGPDVLLGKMAELVELIEARM